MSYSAARWDGTVADAAHAVRGQYAAALPALGMVVDGLLGDVPTAQLDALQTVERAVGRAAVVAADLVTLAGAACCAGGSEHVPCAVPELLAQAEELCRKTGVVLPRSELEAGLPGIFIRERLCAAVLCVLLGRAIARGGARDRGEGTPARIVATAVSRGAGGGAAGDDARSGAEAVATTEGVLLLIGAVVENAEWTWEAEDERDAALILCRGIVETSGGRLLKNKGPRPSFRLDLPARRAGNR